MPKRENHVIIAGFGIGGRFIAEYLQRQRVPFVLVELNRETTETQRALGVDVLYGDVSDEAVLRAAGIERALVLALAVPDDAASIRATEIARRIQPSIHIIAGTRYTSSGMAALQKGADEVIVAEQAVGHEFYRRIAGFMSIRGPSDPEEGGIDEREPPL
ncbi:MAG: NAD-binding protein [Planctomycetes bacterium]|nr:NAD-binding protein [Planctomycetota bacterium]